MRGTLPTPHWEDAPDDIRRAWHDLNNTHQRAIALIEQATQVNAELASLLQQLVGGGVKH